MRRILLALGVPALIAVMLGVDHFVDLRGQLALGALAFAILAGVCTRLPNALRLQAVLIVAVATCGEVMASLVWGLYTYRLENVPLFVPPGHALVYLGGLAVAYAFTGRERWLTGAALLVVCGWALAGVTVLPRTDWSGSAAAAAFAVVLARRPRAHLYAGVFVVVAFLELYGTAIGTWAWAVEVPTLGVPQGNPPSGAAIGYVLMEATAVRLALWGGGVVRAWPGRVNFPIAALRRSRLASRRGTPRAQNA